MGNMWLGTALAPFSKLGSQPGSGQPDSAAQLLAARNASQRQNSLATSGMRGFGSTVTNGSPLGLPGGMSTPAGYKTLLGQ